MKLRGTLGGFGLLLESSDTPESLLADLNSKAEFLRNSISIEFTDTVDGALFAAALHQIQASGGTVKSVRGHSTRVDRTAEVGQPILPKLEEASNPSGKHVSGRNTSGSSAYSSVQTLNIPSSDSVLIRHSLRAGTRAEYSGSVVVLGDVNSGVELIAQGDIVVLGALRGVVHAGAGGNMAAVVVGYPIASPIIRIGSVVANDPEASGFNSMRTHAGEGQIARVDGERILIVKYTSSR
jgi:septum site-determining protein MinC